jgi:hypothetical protein
MEKGYEIPVGCMEDNKRSIHKWIVKSCKQKEVKVRRDTLCTMCGKKILQGEKCQFGNLRISALSGCPFIFANLWWHQECEFLSYEQRKRALIGFSKDL